MVLADFMSADRGRWYRGLIYSMSVVFYEENHGYVFIFVLIGFVELKILSFAL